MKTPTTILSLFVGLVAILASVHTKADEPKPEPNWSKFTLLRVLFDQRDDLRRGRDRWTHRVNEDGIVDGNDFLNLAKPIDRKTFDEIMKARGGKGDFSEEYTAYLKNLVDQGMSLLILNRIVDHEAMKMKLDPNVNESRASYILTSVLTQNAMASGKVKTREEVEVDFDGNVKLDADNKPITKMVLDENLSKLSFEEQYGWLKETVGDKSVAFNINWKFREGPALLELESISVEENPPVAWTPVRIVFEKLPATWQEALAAIENKLQSMYVPLMRQRAWYTLARKGGYLDDNWKITVQDMERLYEAMEVKASAHHVIVSGPKSDEFTAKFISLLKEKEKQLTKEITEWAKSLPKTAENQKLIKARVLEVRNSVPQEVLTQTKAEFIEAEKAKELSVRVEELSFSRNGKQDFPCGMSGEQFKVMLNPMFGMRLLPVQEFKNQPTVCAGTTVSVEHEKTDEKRLVILKEQVPAKVALVDLANTSAEDVAKFVRAKMDERLVAKGFRDLAYDLFKRNSVHLVTSTCEDPNWPCADLDPVHLTEVLFPERLYPGKTLSNLLSMRTKKVTSTLKHPELFDRVIDIQLKLFENVFKLPNEHVDSKY